MQEVQPRFLNLQLSKICRTHLIRAADTVKSLVISIYKRYIFCKWQFLLVWSGRLIEAAKQRNTSVLWTRVRGESWLWTERSIVSVRDFKKHMNWMVSLVQSGLLLRRFSLMYWLECFTKWFVLSTRHCTARIPEVMFALHEDTFPIKHSTLYLTWKIKLNSSSADHLITESSVFLLHACVLVALNRWSVRSAGGKHNLILIQFKCDKLVCDRWRRSKEPNQILSLCKHLE